ncbi:MAG TPA: radical SAM protein [Candidatus Eisenbacteria bacterium]
MHLDTAGLKFIPDDLLLVVSYRCNSRCVMCGIWEGDQSSKGEMTPEEYRATIPDTLTHVNITGGETFLRRDLVDVVAAVKEAAPKAAMTISTNGLQPSLTRRLLPDILRQKPDIGFAVSIDGDETMHDTVRGIPGNYNKCIETVRAIQEAGSTNVRIGFTAMGKNDHQLTTIYRLAKELGVQFTCAVAHNSDHYFKTHANHGVHADVLAKELDTVAREELRSTNVKSWFRAYFQKGLGEFAATGQRPVECEAAHDSYMMDPKGFIFPCNILNMPIGNVREQSFREIWTSQKMDEIRHVVRNCQEPCWMVCTARSAIKRHLPEVSTWVLVHKLKAHFGMTVIPGPGGSPKDPSAAALSGN